MEERKITFPQNFLWGTATASHQVEGGNTNNNWSSWEREPDKIVLGESTGLACDWWGGRWEDDFDRAQTSGQNAHRLSLEWSRIEPQEGHFDEEALQFYRKMLEGLAARKMKPMVTLHHFTDPLWFTEQGGWENPKAPKLFENYVRIVVKAFSPWVDLWCTINEPNVYVYCGYLAGVFPPGKKSFRAAFRVLSHMVEAHALAYKVIHEIQSTAKVGIALNYRVMKPANEHCRRDRWVARLHSRIFNEAFVEALDTGTFRFLFQKKHIPLARRTQDFLGINYYTSEFVEFGWHRIGELWGRHFFPKDAPLSENGFLAHVPEGMKEALHWAKKFGVPLFVTENGVEDSHDALRPHWLVSHIQMMAQAMEEGCPVQGYFHWSLVDNFEWERAWTQRFGLWELDTTTQERTERPSAKIYADICKENALRPDLVEKYGVKS